MKKLVAGVAALAILVGAGLAVFFGLFADRGGGQISPEALAVGLYGEDTSGSWSCDDMREIVNPRPVESLPAIVAIVEAEDVGFRMEIPNRNVASLMLARAKAGRAFADEREALKDIEDGYLLYIAILREARQGDPGLVVSEDEARDYLEDHSQGTCESGALVRPEAVTDEQMVRAIQIDRTTIRYVQELINSSFRTGGNVDKTVADMIARARPTVKITEVAFAPAGALECATDGTQVPCPSSLPTPEAAATP